jgi:hypothetical protein
LPHDVATHGDDHRWRHVRQDLSRELKLVRQDGIGEAFALSLRNLTISRTRASRPKRKWPPTATSPTDR